MNLLFLGTSAGVPTKTRNVSGVALHESKGKGWYLVDCGEGTQHQVLHTKLTFHSLKAILITHVHGDHCYGLPGILASAAMGGRTAPLPLVAPRVSTPGGKPPVRSPSFACSSRWNSDE